MLRDLEEFVACYLFLCFSLSSLVFKEIKFVYLTLIQMGVGQAAWSMQR